MKDNGNPTVAQRNCVKYASEFTEEENKGVNSLQTSSSTSTQIDYCAKLDGPDDAVAVAELIIEKKYTKYEAFLRLCSIYQDGMRGIATDKNFEVGKLVSFIGISNIFK